LKEEMPADPFPKLYNMADQTFVNDGSGHRGPEKASTPKSFENKPYTCGQCGTGYNTVTDYNRHQMMCIPDEEFGLINETQTVHVDRGEKKSSKNNDSNGVVGADNPKLECEYCSVVCENPANLTRHQSNCKAAKKHKQAK